MQIGKRHVFAAPLLWGAAVIATSNVAAQTPNQMIRIATSKVKLGMLSDYQEGQKLLNAAYKKAGSPWREVWSSSLFGEAGVYVSVSPVSSMAQFDSPSPMSQMSLEDRLKYQNLSRNCIESTRYVLGQTVDALSIRSQRTTPPKYARVLNVQTKPGKQVEFESFVKTIVLPAMKNAGVKDYWVIRTLMGGGVGSYTELTIFDKWDEIDAIL
ncbi:MAG: hypothetical protein HY821_21775 [Acidobacteria bacterium]|nr:hypothetical protein [Acidobacteriota bacterium]